VDSGLSWSGLSGDTSKTVALTINGDALHEGNETFLMKLSGAKNASLADSSGTGTLSNSLGPFSIYVSNAVAVQTGSGPSNETFTLSLSAAPVSRSPTQAANGLGELAAW
jgi:hypothetical protein